MPHFTHTAFLFMYFGSMELARLLVLPVLAKINLPASWDIAERTALPAPVGGNRSTIWLHGASIGESRLIEKFLRIIRSRYPHHPYFITAATRSGVKQLKRLFGKEADVAIGYLPLDSYLLMKQVMQRRSIERIWLMETEIWPGMIRAAQHLGVPVGLVNARIEPNSFANYRRMRFVFSALLRYLDPVLAQSPLYAQRLRQLGVRPGALKVTGNIKSSVRIHRPPRELVARLRARLKIADGTAVITAGCIHPGEGNVLKQALDMLACSGLRFKCAVIPRHLQATAALLQELGNGAVHLTQPASDRNWDICVIEQFGILDEMYSLCDIAFVGGSFVDVGAHNVWEAAQYGVPVLFGPDYHTQMESCENLIQHGIGFKVDSAEKFAATVKDLTTVGRAAFATALESFAKAMAARTMLMEQYLP
ncbi:MAG: hypothetical protein GF398_22045 [Chitinivibrionales bacterium]|nr:hypothetical protein [Chitinivibrionales bacterium]